VILKDEKYPPKSIYILHYVTDWSLFTNESKMYEHSINEKESLLFADGSVCKKVIETLK
jgi:hypothetical protein